MTRLPAPTTPLRIAAPVVTAAVRAGSELRGERVIHARGRTLTGRLTVARSGDTGAELFDRPGEHDVLVRCSRGAGLPPPLPDVHGVAIRVLDAYGPGRHQDLLYSSTFGLPVLRWLPVPVMHARMYGSLLPYDVGGELRMLGARHVGDELELLIATRNGPWQAVASVTVGGELPAPAGRKVRFNVANTGGGIEPRGFVHDLRRRAYPASRVGPDA
jgi:hypothetical protein